jgi:hypothetical protein
MRIRRLGCGLVASALIIAGCAGEPVVSRPQSGTSVDASSSTSPGGRPSGGGEQVFCSFPNMPNPHLVKVEVTEEACSKGGGTNLGPVT